MAARKKAPKVKKYKSIQTATKARRVTGSLASRKTSTAYAQASRRRNTAGGAGSLNDIIIRTINGLKVPVSSGSSDKKKRK